jgi:hypothetical protein
MAALKNKMETTREANYKEAKLIKRGTIILGGAAAVVLLAPMVFVMFHQVSGSKYLKSENEKSTEAAMEEG